MFQNVSKAQICRMVEAGKDLWRSFGQISLLKTHLPKTMSRRLLHISKDEDSKTFLSNLCQCSVTITVKKYFLMFTWNLLCSSLCLLTSQWAALKRTWLHPLCIFPLGIYILWLNPSVWHIVADNIKLKIWLKILMSSINTSIALPICKLNKAIWCCGVMAKA